MAKFMGVPIVLPCSCGAELTFYIYQFSRDEAEFEAEVVCEEEDCRLPAQEWQYEKAMDKFWDGVEDMRLEGWRGDPYGGDGPDD